MVGSAPPSIGFQRMADGARTPTSSPALAIQQMKPRHVQLLLAVAGGMPVVEAAKLCRYSINRATIIYNSPLFQQHYQAIVRAQLDRAASGTYGALAVFRSHAEEMATIVVNLAKNSRNDHVRYASAKDILDRCGLAPAKRQEVLNVNELLDAMTGDELDRYIDNGEWPERLRDKVMTLASLKRENASPSIDVTPEPGPSDDDDESDDAPWGDATP